MDPGGGHGSWLEREPALSHAAPLSLTLLDPYIRDSPERAMLGSRTSRSVQGQPVVDMATLLTYRVIAHVVVLCAHCASLSAGATD